MLFRNVAILLAFATCHQAFGQQANSVEAYRMMYEAQRASNKAAYEWNSAIKLARTPKAAMNAKMEKKKTWLDPLTMQTGDMGEIDNLIFRVLSVSDRNTVILAGLRATIMLEGYDTSELVTDANVVVVGPIKVTGTRDYATVVGSSRTIKTVRFANEDEEAVIAEEKRLAQYKAYKLKNGTVFKAIVLSTTNDRIFFETLEGKKVSYFWTAFHPTSEKMLPPKSNKMAKKK
jgi:hypothetical protein